MDNQQLMAQMLMSQMGGQQPQGGMQPAMSGGQSAVQGGSDILKMLMLKKMMAGQQQPQTPSPNNGAFGQAFQQQNPATLGVAGPQMPQG